MTTQAKIRNKGRAESPPLGRPTCHQDRAAFFSRRISPTDMVASSNRHVDENTYYVALGRRLTGYRTFACVVRGRGPLTGVYTPPSVGGPLFGG